MKIEKATAEDFEGVFALLRQLWPDRKLKKAGLKTVFLKGVRSDDQVYLVAREKGVVAGFGSLSLRNSLWQGGPLAWVDELVIDGRLRARGIGGRLLKALIAGARKRFCRHVKLDSALHRKKAHAFYEQKGFKRCAYTFCKRLH